MDEKQQSDDFVSGHAAGKQQKVALHSFLPISSSVLFLPHHSCLPRSYSQMKKNLYKNNIFRSRHHQRTFKGSPETPSNFYSNLDT